MTKKAKDIKAGKKFRYRDKNEEYVVQLKRRNWWWLLLLLLLLFFVKCHKDITVTCIDAGSGEPIEGQAVTLNYEAHYLMDIWRVLPTDNINITQETDSTGTIVFRDLPCSVFSYFFYCMSEATFTANSECHEDIEEEHNFHFTRYVKLQMTPRREDLQIRLLDLETGDPLPDAMLYYQYTEQGEQKQDSAHTDPAGVATIPQMRICSDMNLLLGRCYGYADTTKVNVPCQELLGASENAVLRLRPLKKRFTFFVKDLYSKQPIPGAECYVTLTRPNGYASGPYKVLTSTDGKGIAVFDSAFVRATIAIEAQKRPNYNDSILTGGPWTVEDFIKQPDSTRSIWLRPLPFMREFVNVDSIKRTMPIPGVTNVITIKHPNGTIDTVTTISNNNGVFSIRAEEDAEIEIVSTKNPDYYRKITLEKTFKNAKREIPLTPVMVTLQFRTISALNKTPLPSCSLKVSGSVSGNLPPANSGNTGVFNVTFRKGEELSIIASKKHFGSNSSKVHEQTWGYLNVSQNRRDIPLKVDPIVYENQDCPKYGKKCYPLFEENRTFRLDWDLCRNCTMIIVQDAKGNELERFGTDSPNCDHEGPKYNHPGNTYFKGSIRLKCPTETVCVIIKSWCEDEANFKITCD